MFRRRRQAADEYDDTATAEPDAATPEVLSGPFDIDQIDLGDGVERLDLGGLVLPPMPGFEVQLQVDEASQTVQAVLVAGADGAVELRPFAAPRGGDLWEEVRPEIAIDMASHGGRVEEREGAHGIELVGVVPVDAGDGQVGHQPSRIVGVNGPRWLLRATFLGRPALEPDDAAVWDDVVRAVIVRRGTEAMPVGDPIPLRLPPSVRRQA